MKLNNIYFKLNIALVIGAVLAIVIYAQRDPPTPIPPNASTVVCGEFVLTPGEIPTAIEYLREQGCTHTEFDYIWDGFYLGRGTKIVVNN